MYKCYKSGPESQLLNTYQHITAHRVTEENLKSYTSKAEICDFSDYPESTHLHSRHHIFLLVEFSIVCNLGKKTDPSDCFPLPPPVMETKGVRDIFYPLLIQCREEGRKSHARNSPAYPWLQDSEAWEQMQQEKMFGGQLHLGGRGAPRPDQSPEWWGVALAAASVASLTPALFPNCLFSILWTSPGFPVNLLTAAKHGG